MHALIALFVAVLAAVTVAPISATGAAGTHRAGVIVDTGSEVHRVVITFSEDWISGVQALERAGASPVVKGYALGAAICSLHGVGHGVDSCLGSASDARYWGYWHVPQGQTGFTQATFSGAGAGSVQVRDGDIEGWRFGNGVSQPPPFATIDQIEPPPPPTSPPPAAPSATAGATASSGGSGTASGGTTGEIGLPSTGSRGTPIAPTAAEAAAAAATAAGDGSSSTSSTNRKGAATEVATERASASRGADDGGGSPVPSMVGFVAVLVVLGAGIFFARRARVGRSAGGS